MRPLNGVNSGEANPHYILVCNFGEVTLRYVEVIPSQTFLATERKRVTTTWPSLYETVMPGKSAPDSHEGVMI